MFLTTKKFIFIPLFLILCSSQLFASKPNSYIELDFENSSFEIQAHKNIKGIYKPTLFGQLPRDIKKEIVLHAVGDTCDPNQLRFICKDFRDILRELLIFANNNEYKNLSPALQYIVKAYWGGFGHSQVYEKFLNAVLIYRNTVLRLSDLKNPFCGTFDLGKCGDSGKHLILTTDLKRFFTYVREDKDKFFILFTLHNLIAQRIDSTAKPFKKVLDDPLYPNRVMDIWDSRYVGIFCRKGSWSGLSYCDFVKFHDYYETNLWLALVNLPCANRHTLPFPLNAFQAAGTVIRFALGWQAVPRHALDAAEGFSFFCET